MTKGFVSKQYKERKGMPNIILASASLRRSEILKRAGIEHIVIEPLINEGKLSSGGIVHAIRELAGRKAEDVWRKTNDKGLIIAADTIVCLGSSIMGKPADNGEARLMISKLSGCWHKVMTGYCIMKSPEDYVKGHEVTYVRFRKLHKAEIEEYINTDEPYDKAGGYGIQSRASVFVKKINGCYFNVMGLPVCKIFSILKEYESKFEIIRKTDKEY
jgi:septum formation protein